MVMVVVGSWHREAQTIIILRSFLNCYPAVVPIEEAYLPLVVGFEYKYNMKDSIPLIRLITNC